MSTPLDYAGRQYDLLALRGASPVGNPELSQTLFGGDDAGEICTGIQRLAQSWMLEFFTILGSMPFLPGRGCNFMLAVQQGRLRTDLDVIAAFNIAAIKIGQSLTNDQTAATPLDERYASAQLTNSALSSDQLVLDVTITSMAGSSREVILPIPLLPSPLAISSKL